MSKDHIVLNRQEVQRAFRITITAASLIGAASGLVAAILVGFSNSSGRAALSLSCFGLVMAAVAWTMIPKLNEWGARRRATREQAYDESDR